jgi:hypothetical protein
MVNDIFENGTKPGRALSALIHFTDEVERERAIRWIEELRKRGHVQSYTCEEYNPNWGFPVWYIP